MNNEISPEQNVFLYDRKKLEMTGITDVTSFSDLTVEMTYSGGCIAVDGKDLKIEAFSADSGKITVTGLVNSVVYYGKAEQTKGGFLHRFLG